jgi:hypothetical protein
MTTCYEKLFPLFEDASKQSKRERERERVSYSNPYGKAFIQRLGLKNGANRINLVLGLDNGKLPKKYHFELSELSRINRS